MRPQTAAAAILLLAIGGALIFVQPKPDRSTAQVEITEHGVPGQPADEPRPFDDRPSAVAAAPHRDEPFALGSGTPLAVAERPAEESRGAAKDKQADENLAEPPSLALRRSAPASEAKGAQVGGAGPAAVAAAPFGAVAGDDLDTSGRKREAPQLQEGYAGAMALYNAHRYAEAEPALAAVAAAGGRNAPMAALYAAKSAKESQGCSVAGPRFEQVWVRYSGTNPGAEALWEAANCYKALGDIAKAARYYRSLRDVAGFGDRAETELQNLAPQRAAPAKPAAPAATQQRQQQPAASGATGR